MRSALPWILPLAALAAIWLVWPGGGPPPDWADKGSPPADENADRAAGGLSGEPQRQRAEDAEPEPAPVPGAGHARLLVRVQDSKAPLAGAAVYRRQDGARLGTSDEAGAVEVELSSPTQVVVHAEGYLLRLITLRGQTPDQPPPVVELAVDRYTVPQRFSFEDSGGRVLDRVAAVFSPAEDPPAGASPLESMPALPADTPNPIRRAFTDHVLIAANSQALPLRLQAGALNAGRVFHLAGRDQVRFARPGTYRLHAAAGDLVGAALFSVRAGAPVLRVPLAPGTTLRGQVVAAEDGTPIAGARVGLRGGDPLQLHSITGADGRFSLAPVAAGAVTLEVLHPDHETLVHGPVVPGGELRLAMVARSLRTLAGRVRSLPSRRGLAGAQVAVRGPEDREVRTTTDVAGRFSLRVPASGILRLEIRARDHLLYREVLVAGAPELDYDLLPARLEDRVRAGLSGLVSGTVRDSAGAPVAGVRVRLRPQRPVPPPFPEGRRILEGGLLAPPLVTSTDASGRFFLETVLEGPATLFVEVGNAAAGPALSLDLRRGKAIEDLAPVISRRP